MSDTPKTPKHYKDLDPHEPRFVIKTWIKGNSVFKQNPEMAMDYSNCLKYLARFDRKGTPVADLEKAQTYLGWLIEDMKNITEATQNNDLINQDFNCMLEACCRAKESKLPIKVGCVIARNHGHIISTGKNHIDGLTVCHAETNALNFLNESCTISSEDKLTLYTTKAICMNCAIHAVTSNIKHVVMAKPYEINPSTGKASKWFDVQMKAWEYLQVHGVTVECIDIHMKAGIPCLPDIKLYKE